MSQTTGYLRIQQRGLLAVRGIDAAKFLQGQLTCNLNYISQDHSSLGARCNPKGRMQSSFRLVQQGDGYLLALSADLLERQLAELQKFAVFSKSKLSDESSQWTCFGLLDGAQALQDELGISLASEAGSVVQHNNMLAIRISDQLSELWVEAAQAGCVEKQLAQHLPLLEQNSWQLELIRLGTAQVGEKNFESYVPQMLNLPAQDGVSFKKGCYTGQEIVARMQYLGQQKRQMLRFTSADLEAPAVGTPILASQNQSKAGEVVSAATTTNGIELLAVVQVEAVDNGLCLEGSSNLLHSAPLPYSIDVEREITR